MKRLTCLYTVVRFAPYPESGEFANVGVVLLCPKTGYFDFKLQNKTFRFTHFFRDLEAKTYKSLLNLFKSELIFVKERFQTSYSGADEARLFFEQLTRPVESVLTYGEVRAVMGENPASTLELLYNRIVEQGFVTADYKEKQSERMLEKQVAELLNQMNLSNPFRKKELGSADYRIHFPFVQMSDGKPQKVIKPFFMAHERSNQIYDHADRWRGKLTRLAKRNQLPRSVLLAVSKPEKGDKLDERLKAYDEMYDELNGLEFVSCKSVDDNTAIRSFAVA